MSDEDFEALVECSEALARDLGPERRELTAFEQLVADAIDRLPPEFAEVIDHVPVVVSDSGAEIHAYGEYYGATIALDRAAHRIVIILPDQLASPRLADSTSRGAVSPALLEWGPAGRRRSGGRPGSLVLVGGE